MMHCIIYLPGVIIFICRFTGRGWKDVGAPNRYSGAPCTAKSGIAGTFGIPGSVLRGLNFFCVYSFLGHLELSDKISSKTPQYMSYPPRVYFCVKILAIVAPIYVRVVTQRTNSSRHIARQIQRSRGIKPTLFE